MLKCFFSIPNIEVWPTFESRIIPQLYVGPFASSRVRSTILDAETYDNEFRFSRGVTGFTPIITVRNMLNRQFDGRPGELLVEGQENVFYCQASDPKIPGFALQAQWLIRDYDREQNPIYRWLVLGWQLSRRDDWPNWGTYRPAGSKIFW